MRLRRSFLIAVLALVPACRGRQAQLAPAPSTPEATLTQFLAAVNANDLSRMALLWGTERGPSTTWNPNSPAEQRQQLMIMQRVLITDSHRITGADIVPGPPAMRRLHVEIVRGERRTMVPFVLVEARTGGWLVQEIGIDALMGTPGRSGS
jgi:hypothetical protein